MVDNLEVTSAASSDISDSYRDLILGRPRRRPKIKATKSQETLKSFEVVPSNEPFEIIPRSGENIGELGSYHTAEGSPSLFSQTQGSPHKEGTQGSLRKGEIEGSVHREGTQGSLHKEGTQGSLHKGEIEGSVHREGTQGSLHKEGTQGSLPKQETQESLHKEGTQGSLHKEGTQVSLPKQETQDSLYKEGTQESLHKEGTRESLHREAAQEPSYKGSLQKHNGSVMMSSDERKYTTIETQTVAIQTIAIGTDPDLDCRCSWEDNECTCPECQPNNCRYGYSKKRTVLSERSIPPEDTSEASNTESYTESSSHVIRKDEKRRARKYCTCNCGSWNDYDAMSEQLSESDDSYTTDFLDLPYQNNDEYLKLLRELEKKLISRNRERVRKTMMEFERRSRQNQNLDKPICDYDDSASLLQKLASKTKTPKNAVCCKCGKNKRVNSDILQNEKRWDEMSVESSQSDIVASGPPNRIERSLHKSHWQLDPRTGEWVKVSCFQQTDFSRPSHGDHVKNEHKKVPPAGGNGGHKKECCCRQKKRH